MKYRIVSKINFEGTLYYYPEVKWLGLFWSSFEDHANIKKSFLSQNEARDFLEKYIIDKYLNSNGKSYYY